MNNLERRYRLLLKVLPRWYRLDREEEMAGLFLVERTDELDLEHSWPGWGETWAMLGLAVRTRFAAAAAPVEAVRLGAVVRWLAVLGLLLGFTFIAPVVYSEIYLLTHPEYQLRPGWFLPLHFVPVVAFALLLRGQRGWAKALTGALLAFALVQSLTLTPNVMTVVWQVPAMATFVCLCLGFHREAPAPAARPVVWWGGAALVLGVADVLAQGSGVVVLAAAVLGLRVYAYVGGDLALGRALSVFAVLFVGPVLVTYVPGPPEFVKYVVVAAVLLVISAAAPVRRASVRGSRLP